MLSYISGRTHAVENPGNKILPGNLANTVTETTTAIATLLQARSRVNNES